MKTPQPRTGLTTCSLSLHIFGNVLHLSGRYTMASHRLRKVLLAAATHVWALGLLSPSRAERSGPRETTQPTKPGIPYASSLWPFTEEVCGSLLTWKEQNSMASVRNYSKTTSHSTCGQPGQETNPRQTSVLREVGMGLNNRVQN